MKRLVCILTLILLVIITGCSNNSTVNIKNTDDNFVIGVDENYPPFAYTNDEGELVGFDLSLAQAVADQLGQELVIYPINWSEKDEVLESGAIDAIWSGLSITPEREKIYAFSQPYLDIQPVIVVEDDSNINSVNDLVDKVVGVQEGSVAYEILQELPIYDQIDHETLFEENVNALKNLDVGLTDAVIVDSSVANWYITDQMADYKIVDSLGNLQLGIAFDLKNTELRDEVDKALQELKSNGTSDAISVQWFGEDDIA